MRRGGTGLGELLFHIFLLIFFGIMFVCSTQIEIWNDYVGARYWPMVLIGIAVVLLGIKTAILWNSLLKEKGTAGFHPSSGAQAGETRNLLLSFALCFLYVIFLPSGGFLLSTFLFAGGFSWVLGARRIHQMILSGLCSSVPIFMIFVWGLNIRLPRGIGVLYTASLWLERLIR